MRHLFCYCVTTGETIEGEVLFMFGKMKKIAAFICFGIQIAVSVLYGFTEVGISKYICLIIWLVCGMLEILLLRKENGRSGSCQLL